MSNKQTSSQRTKTSDICKDLSIDVEDGDKEGKDSATQVIVEVSSSPMPSKGKVLLEDVLPLNAVTLNENLRIKKLSSIGSAFKYCGNFYMRQAGEFTVNSLLENDFFGALL